MNDQRFVLFLLLCLIAGSNSQLQPQCQNSNQNLVNTVVYEGNSSAFFNQLDPNGVTWEIAPSYDLNANGPYTVADGNAVQQPFIGVYAVTPTQLSILTASIYPQSSDPYPISGLYLVTYKTDGCMSLANLIVVTKGPLCQCTVTDSDNADLSCELDYGVAQILPNYPTMTWYDDSGNQVAPTDEPTPDRNQPNYDVSTSYDSITSSDTASYTCKVAFTAPVSGVYDNMATNAPNFTASCTVANCVVKTTTTSTEQESTTNTPNPNSQRPACQDPSQNLVNTVVYEGNSSSFFNQFDPNGVTWQISPSFDPNAITNPPYLVVDNNMTPYPGVYAVTKTQLGIPTASIYPQSTDPYSSSGLYAVTYKTDGCRSVANLIVVSQGPLCQCTAIDEDNAQLSCQLNYGVTHIFPNIPKLTWYADSGDQIHFDVVAPNQDDPNYDVSKSTTSITSSGVETYTCGVTFPPPDSGAPANMATNAPSFTASCTIPNCVKKTIENPSTAAVTTNTATTAGCPKDLENIVVHEGDVAVFENFDDGEPIKWHYSSSSDPENNLLDVTDYDFKVNPMFVGAYNVTKTKLTILSATVAPNGHNPYANAGVYFLTYQSSGCQTAANLIVIQSRPVCDRNENDPNNVILSCNISYAESQRQPSYPTMTWTTGSGVVQGDTPTTHKYAYVYESLSQIAVDNTAPSYYQCQVTFDAPASNPIPFLAQNAPSYTESCTVASGTFPPSTEIATTTAGTSPPTTTTEIATTTEVCVDRPNCSSKWLSDPTAFCLSVQEFQDDCPALCNVC